MFRFIKSITLRAAIFLVIPALLGFFSYLFPAQVLARSGCCSWHGGVCTYQCSYGGGTGYECCDGTSLSSTCAPYYPSCPSGPVVTTKTEVETVPIAFKTEQDEDSTILEGETNVVQQGVNGSKEITYKVTYTDGVETSRKKVSEVVVKQPVNKIVAVGTKQEAAPIAVPEEPGGEVAGASTEALTFGDWVIGLAVLVGIPLLIIKKLRKR